MSETKKQRYFVEIPNWQFRIPAQIHKAEIISRNSYPALDKPIWFKIRIENKGDFDVVSNRVYNSFEAALAAKKEYDLQEIERCKRFITELERSHK